MGEFVVKLTEAANGAVEVLKLFVMMAAGDTLAFGSNAHSGRIAFAGQRFAHAAAKSNQRLTLGDKNITIWVLRRRGTP